MKKMDKELLHRYLEQGGDAGVRESLREWFLEHDADAELSLPEDDPVGEELHAFWERSLRRAASQRTPADRYRALSERLFGRKLRMQRFWRRVSQVAAVLLVPLVVCAYLFASQPASEPAEWVEVYAPYGQTRQVTLPDGSRVWLNSGTYVFYPDRFDRERRLFVSGEAYMDVTKDPDRPFRVDTRNVSIRVLGTRFNVRSYTGDKYVETSLLEGSVSLELKRESGTAILMRRATRSWSTTPPTPSCMNGSTARITPRGATASTPSVTSRSARSPATWSGSSTCRSSSAMRRCPTRSISPRSPAVGRSTSCSMRSISAIRCASAATAASSRSSVPADGRPTQTIRNQPYTITICLWKSDDEKSRKMVATFSGPEF